jgi:hypothetical protein
VPVVAVTVSVADLSSDASVNAAPALPVRLLGRVLPLDAEIVNTRVVETAVTDTLVGWKPMLAIPPRAF